MRVRTVRSKSGAISVQIVDYRDGRRAFIKHIGSARGTEEIEALKRVAQRWISQKLGQISFFEEAGFPSRKFLLGSFKNRGVRYNFFAETVGKIFDRLGFSQTASPLLFDLSLARIFQPSSKLASVKLLSRYFGKAYSATTVYRNLPKLAKLKDPVEEKLVSFAKTNLGFDFRLVLYDVTTLYFETFRSDEDKVALEETGEKIVPGLRRCGFSKDNKANQPQIVIGLVVDGNGFPLTYSLFEGNKFEGKTILPVIDDFRKKYGVETFTVVADAAMVSLDNIQNLREAGLSYIVGARLGNLSRKQVMEISQKLGSLDGASLKLETDKGHLVCDFSRRRYEKDKWEMEKQINKTREALNSGQALKRLKFLTVDPKTKGRLNQSLIDKTKLILGVKGYYTNLDLDNRKIIDHYHDLWKIEKAFRIAKSDLLVRPVFHFKRESIEAHILICMVALSVVKYVEIKTGISAKRFVEMLSEITDTVVYHPKTQEEAFWRSEIPEGTSDWLKDFRRPH